MSCVLVEELSKHLIFISSLPPRSGLSLNLVKEAQAAVVKLPLSLEKPLKLCLPLGIPSGSAFAAFGSSSTLITVVFVSAASPGRGKCTVKRAERGCAVVGTL